jgi:hypothetical protein
VIAAVAMRKFASTSVLSIMFMSICAKILVPLCLIIYFHTVLPYCTAFHYVVFNIMIVAPPITTRVQNILLKLNSQARITQETRRVPPLHANALPG